VVVDNTDDPDIIFGQGQLRGIVDYLPKSETGVVVYTYAGKWVGVGLP
jgi:hypothetical protein